MAPRLTLRTSAPDVPGPSNDLGDVFATAAERALPLSTALSRLPIDNLPAVAARLRACLKVLHRGSGPCLVHVAHARVRQSSPHYAVDRSRKEAVYAESTVLGHDIVMWVWENVAVSSRVALQRFVLLCSSAPLPCRSLARSVRACRNRFCQRLLDTKILTLAVKQMRNPRFSPDTLYCLQSQARGTELNALRLFGAVPASVDSFPSSACYHPSAWVPPKIEDLVASRRLPPIVQATAAATSPASLARCLSAPLSGSNTPRILPEDRRLSLCPQPLADQNAPLSAIRPVMDPTHSEDSLPPIHPLPSRLLNRRNTIC